MPMNPGISTSYQFSIFADYHQVYLEDSQARTGEEKDTDQRVAALDAWVAQLLNEQARIRHLGVAPGVICILTARNMTVPVKVEVYTQAPPSDVEGWDQVVEASLEVPSGCLVVLGCTDYLPDAPRIAVEPGTYRARVYFGGIDTLSSDGLEGADHYQVALWPAPASEPVILLAKDGGAW
jgi:hypothetical protein